MLFSDKDNKIFNIIGSLIFKINNLIYFFKTIKWMMNQYNKPRDIGTQFYKREGEYVILYEVASHSADGKKTEIIEELSRNSNFK